MIIVLFCIVLTLTQDTNQTPGQIKRAQQTQIRQANNMTYTNVHTYTFLCGRFDDFIVKPSMDYQMKFDVHVYWKQDNVYVSSGYQQGQQIRIIVYQDNQRVLFDRNVYMLTGFTIYARKSSSYTVRFLAAGRITKLVSMMTSSPLTVHQTTAQKQDFHQSQMQLNGLNHQISALYAISSRNHMMQDQIGEGILQNSKRYLIYQIFEAFLIIGVAWFQITSISRLLKGSSIV